MQREPFNSSATLQPRQKAPSWKATAVVGNDFVQVSSDDYVGKYLVLLFYPFDFTYVCPTEIIAFAKAADEFREMNAEVLALSVDSHFTHLAWKNIDRKHGGLGELDIPLVSDFSKTISKDYGVLVEDENDELYGASLRGLYIIDGNQVIRMGQINDAPVGREVEEVKRLVKAFQYTDTHGEVCPHGWKPGSDTIKPDQQAKLEYFGK